MLLLFLLLVVVVVVVWFRCHISITLGEGVGVGWGWIKKLLDPRHMRDATLLYAQLPLSKYSHVGYVMLL